MTQETTPKKEQTQIIVGGMTCTNCAATIEKSLSDTVGVEKVNVNFASEKASVEYNPEKVSLKELQDTIKELGYEVATQKSVFPVVGMTCANNYLCLFLLRSSFLCQSSFVLKVF